MTESGEDLRRGIRKLNLTGVAIIVLLVGGIGAWATTAQLAGAVIAPGTIVVESSVKKVQHPTGGVIGEILVKEGDEVDEGQLVLRLDDTVTRATLGAVRSQLDELMAREARLLAERDDADEIVFPAQLTDRRNDLSVATAVAGEEKLFESRKTARTGQRAQLRERSAQLTADIARARGKISETELQVIQLDQDFRTEVLKDLREAQGKIAELKERVTAAEDQLKRVDLRAPQAGTVHQLAVHTVGGVISNGETIMQIVPRADELVVEAKVAPFDIDQVATGATAAVRI